MDEKSINEKVGFIFKNKGKLCAFAEKADKNKREIRAFTEKIDKNQKEKLMEDSLEEHKRIHYFSIGHQFKNIDTKSVFNYQLNEAESNFEPQRYLTLQLSRFLNNNEKEPFYSQLVDYISNIRHLNSHYLHNFDKINLSNSSLKPFIKEAFELALIHGFIDNKDLSYEDAINEKQELVRYLCNLFYPDNEYLQEVRAFFLALSWDEALEYILFISVDEDYEWKDKTDYTLLTISKGIYPSFWSMLFLVCMFLYKHEANLIVSKIQGLKRTEPNFQYKRNLFTFFSKKMNSQDVDSESQNLVKFEDIMQYLGKYPTCWNAVMKEPVQDRGLTVELKKGIVLEELKRQFPTPYSGIEETLFYQYVAQELLTDEQLEYFQISKKNKDFNRSFLFYYLNSPEQQNSINKNQKKLEKEKKDPYKSGKLKREIKKLKREDNPNQDTVIQKLNTGSIWREYGRNQDRFMLMATRYLAETNYFGTNVQFRVYAYRTAEEQIEQLANEKKLLSKKEYDKLKYHEGRLVAFKTYSEHQREYLKWDTPFVVQNNSIQIKKDIGNEKLIINIQRQLMPYLLQDAFCNTKNDLFEAYSRQYIHDREVGLKLLQQKSITREEKAELSLLFPKRLLHQYCPAIHPEGKQINAFEQILEQSQEDDARYNSLLLQAQDEGRELYFLKRNKGKQYKLRFIRKAWHLMYFRDAYMHNREEAKGHHKSLHITKEEFQDFTRWMYAFDEVKQYKDHLVKLFKSKNFFRNHEFEHLFDFSNSLNQLFTKTRIKFKKWLKTNSPQKTSRYPIENYLSILNDKMWFINITHFRRFLMSDKSKASHFKGKEGQINFTDLVDSQNLIESYYEREDYLDKNKKLFNELKSTRLEDALLYKLALEYLKVKNDYRISHSQVNDILRSDVTIKVKSSTIGDVLYEIKAPFKKLLDLDKETSIYISGSRGYNLEKLFHYILANKGDKDIKPIYSSLRNRKLIGIDEVHQATSHIVRKAIVFNDIAMALERYYIIKNKKFLVIDNSKQNKNRINSADIKELKNIRFSNSNTFLSCRNDAMHLDIPTYDFFVILKELEKQFIKLELSLEEIDEWGDLPPESKSVFFICMSKLHHSLFKKESKFGNTKEDTEYNQELFRENYVKTVILSF